MLKAVIFDLDNTLTDWHGSQRMYCADLLARQMPGLPEEESEKIAAEMAYLGGDGNGVSLREWVALMKARWPFPLSEEEILADRTRRFPEYTLPFPGVTETLERLRGRYKLGILTNGDSAVQRHKMRVAGIAEGFDCVLPSGETPFRKPDPRIFALCLGKLGVTQREALFVGDSYEKDILGALGAGIRAVRVRVPGWPGPSREDVPEIDSLRELPPILERLDVA